LDRTVYISCVDFRTVKCSVHPLFLPFIKCRRRNNCTSNKMGHFHSTIEMWRASSKISLQADGGDEEEVLPLLNPLDLQLCRVSEECSLSRKSINIARTAGRRIVCSHSRTHVRRYLLLTLPPISGLPRRWRWTFWTRVLIQHVS
jgi:hypothetical protein